MKISILRFETLIPSYLSYPRHQRHRFAFWLFRLLLMFCLQPGGSLSLSALGPRTGDNGGGRGTGGSGNSPVQPSSPARRKSTQASLPGGGGGGGGGGGAGGRGAESAQVSIGHITFAPHLIPDDDRSQVMCACFFFGLCF